MFPYQTPYVQAEAALADAHHKMARYQAEAALYRALPRRSLRSRVARVLWQLAERLEPNPAVKPQPLGG